MALLVRFSAFRECEGALYEGGRTYQVDEALAGKLLHNFPVACELVQPEAPSAEEMSVADVEAWLKRGPGKGEAEELLRQEESGKARKTALAALRSYLDVA